MKFFLFLKNIFFLFLFSIFLMGGNMSNDYADFILKNCTVITLDEFSSIASNIAVKDGKIIFVGDYGGVKKFIGDGTKIYDLNFSYVFPGFTDSHCHMEFLGKMLYWVDLRGREKFKDVINALKEFHKKNPSRNLLIGFNLEDVEDIDYDLLNKYFSDIPVILYKMDLHSVFVNKKVFEMAKIDVKTRIKGGKIEKKGGKPTGFLVDRAVKLAERIIPEDSFEEKREMIKLAANHCLKNGLTEVQDAGIDEKIFEVYRDLYKSGELKLRVYCMALHGSELEKKLLERGIFKTDDNMLTLRSVKYFADGSFGSNSALMYEPYEGSKNCGIKLLSEREFESLCEKCAEKNIQVATHAIGDRANDKVLEIYCKILGKYEKRDLRFRIEHVQSVSDRFLKRISSCNILFSIQPIHYLLDFKWIEKKIGKERMKRSYLWNSFVERGKMVVLGTDFPVAPPSPILNYYTAITGGGNGNGMVIVRGKEKLKRMEALKGLTIYPSYAAFQEKVRGRIFPGMVADLTVLDRNIIYEPPKRVKDTRILMTVVNGRVVYVDKGIKFYFKK